MVSGVPTVPLCQWLAEGRTAPRHRDDPPAAVNPRAAGRSAVAAGPYLPIATRATVMAAAAGGDSVRSHTGRGTVGYRLLPHTADVVVEAWAPTRAACLAEAVRGMVAVFADTAGVAAVRSVGFTLAPAGDDALLVRLLEEVIYLVEVDGLVPVDVEVGLEPGGGLRGRFEVAPLTPAMVIGPAPKAIAWYDLEFARRRTGWRCRATVDV